MNVILLHNNHGHVSTTHVAICMGGKYKNTTAIIMGNKFDI
jgi:hypothetical protein